VLEEVNFLNVSFNAAVILNVVRGGKWLTCTGTGTHSIITRHRKEMLCCVEETVVGVEL